MYLQRDWKDIGPASCRARTLGGLEIGYWVRADCVGQGLATEATRALTTEGLALPGIDRIQIHCDPANRASAAIPRKLGYRHRETLRATKLNPQGEPCDTLVFELTADDYASGREISALNDA